MRARDLGLAPGIFPPGPLNAITDVAGVRVGQVTVVEGEATRTGVTAILPHALLPLDQQPQGTNPPTITDLLEQGQGQVKRLDRMLAELERREPELLDTLQSSLRNANELTSNGNRQMTQITQKLSAMMDTLSVAMDSSGKNIVSLTGRLDSEVARTKAGLIANGVSGVFSVKNHIRVEK